MALAIALPWLQPQQQLLPLAFPMVAEAEPRISAWNEAADALARGHRRREDQPPVWGDARDSGPVFRIGHWAQRPCAVAGAWRGFGYPI